MKRQNQTHSPWDLSPPPIKQDWTATSALDHGRATKHSTKALRPRVLPKERCQGRGPHLYQGISGPYPPTNWMTPPRMNNLRQVCTRPTGTTANPSTVAFSAHQKSTCQSPIVPVPSGSSWFQHHLIIHLHLKIYFVTKNQIVVCIHLDNSYT